MIENFFRSLEENAVEYLLISGQATVLYGAATFSEDVDLWLNPTEENRLRFLKTLRGCSAVYHKLTPPLEMDFLLKGHGFHFLLGPDVDQQFYLDIMGVPPRTQNFAAAAATALRLESDWGMIPTVGIKPLVEIKKTQRLEDYPIISNLVLIYFNDLRHRPTLDDYPWALDNLFTLSSVMDFVGARPDIVKCAALSEQGLLPYVGAIIDQQEISPEQEDRVTADLQEKMRRSQRLDREYWKPIISELKQLRSQKLLMPENGPV
jgi:hypothetical protein